MRTQERSFEFARKVIKEEIAENRFLHRIAKDEEGNELKAYENAKLPEYSTKLAAGADFFCAEEIVIPSIWRDIIKKIIVKVKISLIGRLVLSEDIKIEPTVVHTGIKANMLEDEVLYLYNRSSNPKKLGLILANSVGVIDADYFESEENDGEIMFAFYNVKFTDTKIKVGDRIGQGVFQKCLRPTKNCIVAEQVRSGGFGSTGK